MNTEAQPRPYPFSDPDRLTLDPVYEQLRDSPGLIRVQPPHGGWAWLATRYQDVKTVLGDPRFSRARAVGPDEPRHMAIGQRPDTMVAMDPPEHTRLRRVVAKAFTMRGIERLRPWIQQLVDGLLDEIERDGAPADLVEQYAWPIPVNTICELLGVPQHERKQFQIWSDVALSTRSSGRTPAEVGQAVAGLRGFLAELVDRRRREPGEDLISTLVSARDAEDRLTEDEMVGLGVGVLVAGHETTANQIGNVIYLLLTHPEHLASLRERPELLPQAVDELMRFIPLFAGSSYPRVATEDIELGGTLVRAGEAVLPSMMSANRDESVFQNAARLDFERADNPHLAMGYGVHRCLGTQLAKAELEIATSALLRRFPQLRLAVPAEQVPWRVGALQRGPSKLPVLW
ncbi:cytochrome P450 [Actinocrinis sp.]|uniref:cytochrome P450 n=1 Tax=Actinocrinis sp. TaxID=1920516 RepID=UPI002BF98440|nr:cytochrome P450 [Actinocrinis sp.]HXR70970.1 cytochrome P450 [Actinocrinis sp.]